MRGGGGGGKWSGVLLFFDRSYSVRDLSASVKIQNSCKPIAVIDATDGHCWVLEYRPKCSVDYTRQLCNHFSTILAEHSSVTITGNCNMRNIKGSKLSEH